MCGEKTKTTYVRERLPDSRGWTRVSFPNSYQLCDSCLRLAKVAGAIQEHFVKGKLRPHRGNRIRGFAVKVKFDEVIVFAKTFNWLRMMHMQKLSAESRNPIG